MWTFTWFLNQLVSSWRPPPRSCLQMYWNEFNFLWYYWRNSKCQTFFDQHSYSLLWSAFSILVIRPPENPLRTLPSSWQCKGYLTVIRPLQRKRFTKVRRSFISQNLLEESGLGSGDNNKKSSITDYCENCYHGNFNHEKQEIDFEHIPDIF